MTERKIATSVEVLVQVARFESIRIAKYGEDKIEYSSDEERVQKEDELNSDLVADLVRTMRSLPDQLGKKTNAIVEIEEKIQKKIPAWLENNPEPNLANGAQKSHEKSDALANADNEDRKENRKEDRKEETKEETNKTITEAGSDMDDLFGDSSDTDDTETAKEAPKEESKATEKAEVTKDDKFLEEDEDLFAS